jgi:NAD(P)-dependent dehydrogenase (short-subunit alcohol dehydrogenase family)
MKTTGPRVAIVTGATQGLGLALVRGLSSRLDADDLVYLTSHDPARVASAAATISGKARVVGRALDVRDRAAIESFAAELRRDHGGADIVLSNATGRGSPDRTAAAQVDTQVEVSNHATSSVLRHLLPIVRPHGACVVIASSLGQLRHLPEPVRQRFEHAATLDDVDREVERWRSEVHQGTAEAEGWPGWVNIPSKVAQVAAVRAVARGRREIDGAEDRLLVSLCPGLIDTAASRPWFPDMSKAQTPEQAAGKILDLVLGAPFDPTLHGELVRFGKVLPWKAPVDPLPPWLAAGRRPSD